jgi:hypothetical protein
MRREIYCDEDSRNSWHAIRGLIFHVHLEFPFDLENGKHYMPVRSAPTWAGGPFKPSVGLSGAVPLLGGASSLTLAGIAQRSLADKKPHLSKKG